MTRQEPGKVLFAAMLGFAAGILFAPKSGQETREQLKHKAEEMNEKGKDVAHSAQAKVEQGKQKARSTAEKLRHRKDQAEDDVSDEFDTPPTA